MAGDGTALNVVLKADFRRMESDLKKAGVIAEKAVGDIEDKFAKSSPKLSIGSSVLAGFAGGAAAGLIAQLGEKVAALPGQIIEANRELAKLGDTARRVALSTDELQKIQFLGAQNGLTAAQSDQGVKGFASAIAGANAEGSKLGQLLSDNNIKLTTATGQQRNLNDLLADAATLMQGARTEQEKIDIAKLLGLSDDWIRILEKGPEAFRLSQAAAVATGSIIDKEIIQRAKDFDTFWSQSFANFSTWAKSAAVSAASEFRKFLAVANITNDPNSLLQQRQKYQDIIAKNGPTSLKGSFAQTGLNDLDSKLEQQLAPAMAVAKKALAEEMIRQAGASGTAAAKKGDAAFGGLIKPTATNTSALKPTPKAAGGGGGGGLSDEDQRFNQVLRYIEQLEKTGRILQAEKDSIGLTNAERAKAIELARIGTVTDEGQLASLNKQIDANEQLRQAIEKAKMAQKGMNDAAQFAGQELLGAFESLLDGGKIEDAINGITKALMKAALQAAILGQGPLANLFGGASTTGGPGGLIGSLLGAFGGARASGGPVQAGKTYMVGENGPEMVRFGKNGTVMPNSVVGGRGGGGGVNFQVINQSSAQAGQPEVSTGPDGKMMIRMMIRDEFNGDIAKNGPMAQMLQGRYGMNRSGGRR